MERIPPYNPPAPDDPVCDRQRELRAGDLCLLCNRRRLDYDGLLNLACPDCGPLRSGSFT